MIAEIVVELVRCLFVLLLADNVLVDRLVVELDLDDLVFRLGYRLTLLQFHFLVVLIFVELRDTSLRKRQA